MLTTGIGVYHILLFLSRLIETEHIRLRSTWLLFNFGFQRLIFCMYGTALKCLRGGCYDDFRDTQACSAKSPLHRFYTDATLI